LPEKRRGSALLLIHEGEPAPRLPVPLESLDLRTASPEVAASYAIFRRYLFDYRVDLSTPLWFLIDGQGRVRKIYAEAPDGATAQSDLRFVDGPIPDPRALPFAGVYHGRPTRDYYKFGGALLQAGYPEQALPYLEEMLRRSPDNPTALAAISRAWNDLGDAASQSGNTAEAERLYRRALSVNRNDGEAANSLGLLLAKQGHSDEARKLFEQAISIRRDDSSAINNLGVLYLNIGQVNDAIAAFQYGIRVAPDDDILYMNLARIWVRLGDRDKARGVMRDLLARKPDSAAAQNGLRELELP
jgi:Flp pilus assembly protein TadD